MVFNKINTAGYYLATLAGIFAILLWASNIAFSKSTLEQEGYLSGAFLIYFYSSIFVFLLMVAFKKKTDFFRSFKSLPVSYYLKTGIFFIINNVLLFVAVGLANKNEELVIVTLLNYTWPVLIYVIRIPVFKAKIPLGLFIPGIVLSLAGISLALLQGYSADGMIQVLKAGDDNIIAFLLVFIAAFSWAMYSNLTIKYTSNNDLAGIPVIFLLSSLVFLSMLYVKGEHTSIHLSAIVQNYDLLYTVIGPTSLGYVCWYMAIKWGDKTLVTAISYFIPLFSLLFLWVKFHIEIRLLFWIASALLIAGSVMCYRAFQTTRQYTPPAPHQDQ